MKPEYWRERWREGRIGFHQGQPNELLIRHADALGERPARIFVPLCGKAVDLAWLAERGSSTPRRENDGGDVVSVEVVGVELAASAARDFFVEQGIPAQPTVDGPLTRWAGGSIEIVVGDLFDITTAEIGTFDAAYDRAALVALPPDIRPRYVEHVRSLLAPGARVLLISFTHDAPSDHPPFSIEEDEIRRLWHGCRITRLADQDASGVSASLTARGASSVREQAFGIELP